MNFFFQHNNSSCSKCLDCKEQNYLVAVLKMKCFIDIRKSHQEGVLKPVLTKRGQVVECKKPSSIKWSWLKIKMHHHNSVSKQHLEDFGHSLITCIGMKTKCKTLKVTKNEFLPSGQLYGKDQLFSMRTVTKDRIFIHD